MEQSAIIKIIQTELDELAFHCDQDWEYTTSNGNGVNAFEAHSMLSSIADQINKAAGEQLISQEYDAEALRAKYRELGYSFDEDELDEDDE